MAAKLQKKDHKNRTFLWSIAFVVVKTNPTYYYSTLSAYYCIYNPNSFSYLYLSIPNRPRLFMSIHFLTEAGSVLALRLFHLNLT